jgi:hypothetical protein
MTQTIEEFWRQTHEERCVWRTARKAHYCGQHQNGKHEEQEPAIQLGDRYLDTGEVIDVWRTSKCCVACAETQARGALGGYEA